MTNILTFSFISVCAQVRQVFNYGRVGNCSHNSATNSDRVETAAAGGMASTVRKVSNTGRIFLLLIFFGRYYSQNDFNISIAYRY